MLIIEVIFLVPIFYKKKVRYYLVKDMGSEMHFTKFLLSQLVIFHQKNVHLNICGILNYRITSVGSPGILD